VVAGNVHDLPARAGGRQPERVALALHDEHRDGDSLQLRQAAGLGTAGRVEREREAEHGVRSRRLHGAAGDPRPERTAAGDQARAAQLTRDQADDLREVWGARHTGRHRPAIAAGGAKVKPLSVNPEESQFVDSIKANVATICRFYGVPPEMVAGETAGHMAYTSPEQRSTDLLVYAVRPWLVRLERAISALLPRNQYVRFNPDAIVRVTLLDRYQAHKLGIEAGFLTRNEARALEDMAPLPEGGAIA